MPLPIEHYTNRRFAIEAALGHFDPLHPTSLIFARAGDALRIVGVMYTANNAADQDQLDARLPLSFGTWHRHVDFCTAPAGASASDRFGPDARFGFKGSIHTEQACQGRRHVRSTGVWLDAPRVAAGDDRVADLGRRCSRRHAEMIGPANVFLCPSGSSCNPAARPAD